MQKNDADKANLRFRGCGKNWQHRNAEVNLFLFLFLFFTFYVYNSWNVQLNPIVRLPRACFNREWKLVQIFMFLYSCFILILVVQRIDPLHVRGNAANLEDKTKEIFASVKKSYCSVLQIGCIPTDVQGV